MTGAQESRKFYEQYGREMIHEKFPQWEDRIACGFVGHGSECFGYDDSLSQDHDFAPGFSMWLTKEDFNQIGYSLDRCYQALPVPHPTESSKEGSSASGVFCIPEFYSRYTGSESLPEEWQHWLSIPSWALAEATNGWVYRDDLGLFSEYREHLLNGMPEDVRKKKLASRAFVMAQSGQYNYSRCLSHGEAGAAMLALGEFVPAAVDLIFLLNRKHMPYYKWSLRAMKELPILGNMKDALEFLLIGDNDETGIATKKDVIEDICINVRDELLRQHLTHGNWDYLEPHAYEIMEHISDPAIRSLNITEG